MAFFRKPQEKKDSAVREEARAGKRALGRARGGFRMPFFGRDKKQDDGSEKSAEAESVKQKNTSGVETSKTPAQERFGSESSVIVRPRVTEKGSDVAARSNAYVFDVRSSAGKKEIARGIRELYGVDPVKIHVVRVPSKEVRGRRGQRGTKSGGKKAYVYLKKGDTIEFV